MGGPSQLERVITRVKSGTDDDRLADLGYELSPLGEMAAQDKSHRDRAGQDDERYFFMRFCHSTSRLSSLSSSSGSGAT